MNFLAHMFLSFNDEEITIGNYIADFVKGQQINNYSSQVKKGILLHREIDRFTDTHETVKKSKQRLVSNYRHYAPVITDIYYDHFLAKYWQDYTDEKLKNFTTRNYRMLNNNRDILPAKAAYVLMHMSDTDWLFNYQFMDGIEMALSGMARRTKFDSGMEKSINDLKEHYDLYYNEFKAFFAELLNHSHHHIELLNNND